MAQSVLNRIRVFRPLKLEWITGHVLQRGFDVSSLLCREGWIVAQALAHGDVPHIVRLPQLDFRGNPVLDEEVEFSSKPGKPIKDSFTPSTAACLIFATLCDPWIDMPILPDSTSNSTSTTDIRATSRGITLSL